MACGAVDFSEVVSRLSSSKSQVVYDTLVELRTDILKTEKGLLQFTGSGGVAALIDLLQKPHKKTVNITLSILGNCCLNKTAKKKVQQLNGIKYIVKILKTIEVESIKNRACRTLANLTKDSPQCVEQLHQEYDVSELIVGLLKKTACPENQQTYIRALRILGEPKKFRERVEEVDGILHIAKCLTSDHEGVLIAALKALSAFTDGKWSAQQVVIADCIDTLLQLTKHIHKTISSQSLLVLHNLAKHSQSRLSLGAAAIQCFLDHIAAQNDDSSSPLSLHALCLCCRDSVNRMHIRKTDALKLLLTLVESDKYENMKSEVFIALLTFLYDDMGLKILLRNGLVSVLLRQLRDCIKSLHDLEGKEMEASLKDCDKASCGNDVTVQQESLASSRDPWMSAAEGSSSLLSSVAGSPSSVISYTSPNWSPQHSSAYSLYSQSLTITSSTVSPCYVPDHNLPSEGEAWASSFSPTWSCGWSPPSSGWSGSPLGWSVADISFSPDLPPLFPDLNEEPHYSSTEDEADDEDIDRTKPPSKIVKLAKPQQKSTNLFNASYPLDDILPEENMLSPETSGRSKGAAVCLSSATADFDIKTLNLKDPLSIQEQTTLILLSRISQMEDPSEYLVTADAVETLFQYALTLYKPCSRWFRIMKRLCNTPICLEKLIHTLTPLTIQKYAEDCKAKAEEASVKTRRFKDWGELVKQCESLLSCYISSLGESAYGYGTICHILHTGSRARKENTAICTPYLLRSRHKLRHILLDLKVIPLLMDILERPEAPTFGSALKSLVQLGRILNIHTTDTSEHEADVVVRGCPYSESSARNDVAFTVEEGGTIQAQRTTMTESCAMFGAMLEGYYLESQQKTILLADISFRCAEYIVHFIHGCRHQCLLVDGKVNSLFFDLEILASSDCYLLETLKSFISHSIYTRHFHPGNIGQIFTFAVTHGCHWLTQQCLLSVISGEMAFKDRLKVCKEMMSHSLQNHTRNGLSKLLTDKL